MRSEDYAEHLSVVWDTRGATNDDQIQYLLNGLMLEIYRYSARYGDDHHSIRNSITTRTSTENNEFHLTASKRECMKRVVHPIPVCSIYEDDPRPA
jgi:hypothetical protein